MQAQARRRVILYVAGIVLGGGLLFAGFGLTLPPDPGTTLHGAALIGSGMGQYDEALRMTREVLRDYPDHPEAHLYLATFLAASGRHDEAVGAYTRAIELQTDPEVARDARVDRASLLLTMGRRKEFEDARREITAGGLDHRVHLLDGIAAQTDKDWPAAARALERALKAKPGDETLKGRLFAVLLEWGRNLKADGRFEDALVTYGAARQLFPKDLKAPLEAAELLLALERTDDAVEVLRDLDPDRPGVLTFVLRAATQKLLDDDVDGALAIVRAAASVDEQTVRDFVTADPAWSKRRSDPRIASWLTQNETPDLTRLTDSK
jgi:tetratricopeptide (TPR) repeat protein